MVVRTGNQQMERFSNIQRIVDALEEGLFLFDNDGVILQWNAAAERILGYLRDEMIGRSAYIVLRGWTQPWQRDPDMHVTRISEFGEVVCVENKEGLERMLSIRAVPYLNDSGEIAGGVGTFRDIGRQLEELALAQRIQRTLLKSKPDNGGIRIEHTLVSHDVVGGDHFKLVKQNEDRYLLFVGDFTGQGVVGAMYTVMLDKLLDEHGPGAESPASFAAWLNAELDSVMSPGYYCNAVIGVFELDKRTFTYVQAGSPAFLSCAPGGGVNEHESNSPPLGMFTEAKFTQEEMGIEPGHCFLIYSDGIVEAMNRHGEEIGIEGVRMVAREFHLKNGDWAPQDFLDRIKAKHAEHAFEDDVLIVKVTVP